MSMKSEKAQSFAPDPDDAKRTVATPLDGMAAETMQSAGHGKRMAGTRAKGVR